MIKAASDQNSLSLRVYEETRSVHEQVRNHPFILKLKNGNLQLESYVQYIVDLRAIYRSLEKGMEKNRHLPEIHPLYIKELCRLDFLENDILSFQPMQKGPSSEAKAYAEHLDELARTRPFLLIAHAYVRYLGDLSEGKVFGKTVNTLFPGGHDAFYNFQGLLGRNAIGAKYVEFKNYWKKKFDEIPLSDTQRGELIEEAKQAFEYIRKVLDAIEV